MSDVRCRGSRKLEVADIDVVKLAHEVRHYELGTWAGLVNVIGFVALIKAHPSISVIDRAAFWIRALFNDLLSYLALKREIPYTPSSPPFLYPVTDTWPLYKVFASLGSYFIICVITIAVVS